MREEIFESEDTLDDMEKRVRKDQRRKRKADKRTLVAQVAKATKLNRPTVPVADTTVRKLDAPPICAEDIEAGVAPKTTESKAHAVNVATTQTRDDYVSQADLILLLS